jgi:hypothetical protein
MADYAFILNDTGKAFTPNGTVLLATEAEAHNAAIEAAELAHWAGKPDVFCGYVCPWPPSNGPWSFATWRGVELGQVTLGRLYRNNFGARIRSVEVRGSNGATYYGRYAECSTQFIRLRKRKAHTMHPCYTGNATD